MRGLLIASSIAWFAMSVPVLAHHGTGTYDSSKSVTLSGIVTEFAFTNPHAAMFVDVKDENGKIVNWAIEMNSPGVLARAGWTKRMFKYGDQITITVRPAKAGRSHRARSQSRSEREALPRPDGKRADHPI